MALPLAVLLALSAAPAADSQWSWSFDDSRSIKVKGAPAGVSVTVSPHLERSQFEIKVLEAGEEAPKKLKVTVKAGPAPIRAHTYEVESNYGEAVLKDITPKGTRTTWKLNEVMASSLADPEGPNREVGVFRSAIGTLLRPDPVVLAAKSGAPCTDATAEAVVKAVARYTSRLLLERDGEESVKDASATCLGADGTKYAVRFTLRYPFRDDALDFPFTGTVTIAPGAWRAAFDLKGHMEAEVPNSTKKPLVIKSAMSLRIAMTKK